MDLVDVEASVVGLLQVPFKVQETSVSGCVELAQLLRPLSSVSGSPFRLLL